MNLLRQAFVELRDKMLWVVNIIAYVINAVVTGGSQQGWFGRTNDEISDDYPTLITPIG